MVTRPKAVSTPSNGPIDAWEAVQRTQLQDCRDGWAITQPDHAALSGDIAERLSPALFPGVDAAVVRGIRLHDEGWAEFDKRALGRSEPPQSFIQEAPATFVDAWTGSIERAAGPSPIAGMIVSKHFWRLARLRETHMKDSPEDRRLIGGFTAAEERRQQQLAAGCRSYDVEFLTDVLQFCDVLSLYLCCGAGEDVEFSQDFRGTKVSLQRIRTGDAAEICRFTPPVFENGTDLAVAGRRASADRSSGQFLFLLQ